jgi:ribosomal protein L37AE/L43A
MRNSRNEETEAVHLELKYCEHCGGLWLRECGAGVVYCGNCQAKVADLPIPKKKPQRVTLPVGRRPLVEDYEVEGLEPGDADLEAAAGGAA